MGLLGTIDVVVIVAAAAAVIVHVAPRAKLLKMSAWLLHPNR